MTAQPAIIDGRRVDGTSVIDVIDPATGKLLDQTIRGTAADVDAAVDAARRASDGWSHTSYAQRSAVLRRIGDLIRRDADELAVLESRDTGKPLTQARADVAVAARYFEYYANTMEAFFGESLPVNGDFLAYTRHQPYGVTGHIIPWNYRCRSAAGPLLLRSPWETAPS